MGPWLRVDHLLELWAKLRAKLLLDDKRSGGCKEQAVKCISTKLCVCVSRAVEWITVSDTHAGNDLEMTGYIRRREVMELC